LPYAIGNALFGGTAEYVALSLRSVGVETSFFYYVAILAFVTFVAAVLMPELRQYGYLDGDGSVETNTGFSWIRDYGRRTHV
jgi:MHS family dicarboxylic acid transporter PcaT-like MFS transporter